MTDRDPMTYDIGAGFDVGDGRYVPPAYPQAKPASGDSAGLVETQKALREHVAALTNLTAGGSEYFSKRLGDIYLADIPFCVQRIRERMGYRHAELLAIARAEKSEARIADLEAKLAVAEKRLNGCQWYWPESDTSSECCGESAQEIVQNAYDWTANNAGEVVAVARGGIVEVTYCASLPPADDADSDDDFWVQESTKEAAEEKIAAELVRRAQVQP